MNDYFLADDLSGALEVAAAFRNAGRSVTVTWSYESWGACAADEVVGFTTETRNAGPEDAAAAVRRAMAFAQARGDRLRFKKIDSTMRGPVGAELGAMAAALPEAMILFTPANPHAGRTVRDGVLRVNGVPVAESVFGRDPVNPVRESSIRRAVPAGAAARVIALDVATDDDFTNAIEAREAAGGDWVAVGSGAFARVLVQRPGCAGGKGAADQPGPIAPGPVLFVCGSAHPVNRSQSGRLAAERGTRIIEVHPPACTAAVARAVEAIRSSGMAALHIAAREGAGTAADSRVALAAIISAAVATVEKTGARRLMATGGETARALCDALGIRALRVRGDIEPGLVLAGATNRDGSWLMAIKPGGFGTEECWVRAFDALRQRKR